MASVSLEAMGSISGKVPEAIQAWAMKNRSKWPTYPWSEDLFGVDPLPQMEVAGSTAPVNCTPGYDPCLPPAADYDCRGGGGNGPAYSGRVAVTGPDTYGLDADGDGVGCE